MKHTLFALVLAASAAGAQPLALPPPPQATLQEHLGAQLPLATPLRDELGQPVQLGDYFHAGQPVLLVPGYYRCTEMCGLLMHRLLEALRVADLPREHWRIVGVSIAPEEGPADAKRRRALDLAYAAFLQGAQAGAPPRLDLLTGDGGSTARIAQAVGFGYQATNGTYAHPATVIVTTPTGRVSRYFNGLDIDPAQLRSALQEAAGGEVGSFAERLAVLCSHFDPAVGRYSNAVMVGMRGIALLALAGLAAIAWRHRGRA